MIGFAANRNPLQVLKLLEEVDDETRKSKPDAAIPNLPNLRIDAGFRFDDAGDGAVHHGKTQWGCSRWFWGGYSRGCSGCQESRYRLYPEYHFGGVGQEVIVNADASMVTTESAEIGQLINTESIVALPLNGREVQQLVFLIPGAVNVSNQNCGSNCQGGVIPGEQYAKINGGGSNGVYYLLDGVDYNDTYINTNMPFPNPDALQEFNVQTTNMSALYGNATGGVVNVLTKSGTDQIHGDAFEFLRNYAMDARNYFASSPDPLKQNQFGGVVGGPILHHKLFYFGSYQGTRTNTSQNGLVAFVPTQNERNGDFSDLLPGTQLVDPVTGVPFIGNQIPSPRLSLVAQYVLQHIPFPSGPGRQLNYDGVPSVANTNEYLGKVDYNIGKHHLSGHYLDRKSVV